MRKLNVLLLSWDFPPIATGELSETCYGVSKALANRVNLSLILPKSDPEFILSNVDLTGLNNVDLQHVQPAPKDPAQHAFAEANYIRPDLAPYGAATPTGPETNERVLPEQPGQAVSVGMSAGERQGTNLTEGVEELNIFGQTDLNLVDRNSQVIHYARYASRLASQREYDVIYAYDWRTFLAGIELKLVSGKPLVLHMHSVSYEYGGADSKGWIYEIEKQALEKSDAVITNTEDLAAVIEAEYAVKAEKIRFLDLEASGEVFAPDTKEDAEQISAEQIATNQIAAEQISTEIYNMEVSESNNDLVKAILPVKGELEPEENWEAATETIFDILREVTEPAAG